MELYTLLRHFADSWFLAAMTAFFIGAILFAWRPGARKAQAEAANTVFRNDDAPLGETAGGTNATLNPEAQP